MTTQNKIFTKEASIFTRAFTWSGLSFLLICLLGVITWSVADPLGTLKGLGTKQFDWANVYNLKVMSNITKISMLSIGLVFASGIMRIVWWFRFNTASKTFIYTNYVIYIIAQGLGFGLLFTTWRAQEIMSVFGIAGLAFLAMAWAGYIAKDLSKLAPFLIIGSIFMMIITLPMIVLSFVLNLSGLWFAWTVGIGILTLLFIMFDVWQLKKTSEFMKASGGADELTEFRIVSWFGFRLLSDMVQLVWVLARLYMRFNR